MQLHRPTISHRSPETRLLLIPIKGLLTYTVDPVIAMVGGALVDVVATIEVVECSSVQLVISIYIQIYPYDVLCSEYYDILMIKPASVVFLDAHFESQASSCSDKYGGLIIIIIITRPPVICRL